MPSKSLFSTAALAALVLAPTALAQSICWRQPWTRPSASFQSIVESCGTPQPQDLVAMDDFVCDTDSDIVRVHWWGALFDPAQANRPFYIAIYKDVDCQPADQVGEWCVQPEARFAARDCVTLPVFRFSAQLTPAFSAIAGDRYWIQISEIDGQSANPGVEDFRWSSHRPIRDCSAMWRDATGTFITPLTDLCDGKEEDLAFILYSKTISGTVVLPNVLPTVLVLQLYPAAPEEGLAGPAEVLVLRPDENGHFDVAPSVPDGMYDWVLYGMSARPEMGQVMIQDGTETPISGKPIEPGPGDTDSDGNIGIVDLLNVLGNWGM